MEKQCRQIDKLYKHCYLDSSQNLRFEDKHFPKTWGEIEYKNNGMVEIKNIVVMRMVTTKYAWKQIDPNGICGVEGCGYYDVSKTKKEFFNERVLKEWEGKPFISTTSWPCPISQKQVGDATCKFNLVIGSVHNFRALGNELYCDILIADPWSFNESFWRFENQFIAAAYGCEYEMKSMKNRKGGFKEGFKQTCIKPSHFYMAHHGMPNGMEFPLPVIEGKFKKPRPIKKSSIKKDKFGLDYEPKKEEVKEEKVEKVEKRSSSIDFLMSGFMKPVTLTKKGVAERNKMIASAKRRFKKYYDEKKHDCIKCPFYPSGCIQCYEALCNESVSRVKKEGVKDKDMFINPEYQAAFYEMANNADKCHLGWMLDPSKRIDWDELLKTTKVMKD